VATIVAMLNHSDTGTVQRYVQASGVRVADARARLRAVLRGAD